MIEFLGLGIVLLLQVAFATFGYYAAVGHIDRMLDIEEPDSPQIVKNIRKDLFSKKALTVDDIDSMENWDAFDDESE